MLEIEVFICECFETVYRCATGTIAVEKVSALYHEVSDLVARVRCNHSSRRVGCVDRGGTNDSMEFATFVALRPTLSVLC